MSAQEVIDKIRAENIASRLKEKLAEKAKEKYEFYFQREEKSYRKRAQPVKHDDYRLALNDIPAEQLERERLEARRRAEAGMCMELVNGWATGAQVLLKETWEQRRMSPGIAWSDNHRHAARQQFARELGFSSYNRLYRACLLCFGKTIMELEHAAGVELLVELDKEAEPRREKVKEEVLKE